MTPVTKPNPYQLLNRLIENAARREEAGRKCLEAGEKLLASGLVAKQKDLASLSRDMFAQGNNLMSSSALHLGFAARCLLPPTALEEKNMGAVLTASPEEAASHELESEPTEVIESDVVKTKVGVSDEQA